MRERTAVLRALRVIGLAFTIAAPAAFAAVGVNKTFNPVNVSAGQVSTLTVFLLNNNAAAATATAFTDNLPGTVVVANPANTTTSCGGTVTATSGTGSFALAGGSIPAAAGGVAGQCTVTVDVASPTPGVFINIIPAGAVSSSQGGNSQNANATLTVAALQPVTGAKTFAPTNVHGGGTPSTVTLTLTNPNGVALTGAALTDTLPAGLAIASPANTSTTCGAGTVSTGASSATLSNGTIPAAGNCTIKFNVVAANPNAYVDGNVTNSIAANALTTAQGVGNTAFTANVRLQTGARVEKVFAPTPITTGGTSTLTVTVRNFNATPLTGIMFSDTLPGTMRVASPVATATTCTGLTFTPAPLAGDAFFTVSGGSLPAAAAGVANANCTVTINVTATNAGVNPTTLTNTIPVGAFGGVAFSSGSGALVVNATSSVGGSKSFSPGTILQSGVSTLTITLTNSAAVPAAITAFTDLLTTLGASPQFTVATAPAASTTCGGVLNAAPGASTITLGTGNSIPAASSCTITVPVQASAAASTGTRTNSIAQGALQTSQGRTQAAITGPLVVNPVLAVAKAVAPTTVAAGADTRMTITLTRAAGATALSGIAFTDTLPAGHLVSATPNLVNNCGGAVTATSGTNTVSLAGGNLAGGAAATSCTILVNITTPAAAGTATNTIAAGAVSSTQGFVNAAAASATITRVATSVTLNKSFNPATVLVGGSSQLTINVLNTNANAIALATTGLVDTLPVGMVIATPPASSNTCGGTLTAAAGAGAVTLANGTIAANATCRIQLNVVATASGNLTDLLGAGLFTSAQGVTNPLPAAATLAATGVANLAITKTDGVVTVTPGTTTTYAIVASNLGPNAVAGASVTDTPPAGVTFTSWSCVASVGSACGAASGTGPINELVTLLNGGSVTYTVTAAIAPGAAGTISNTATVTAPATVVDPNTGNNAATDTDTLTPVADLAITKTDAVVAIVPGSGITYTIVASNAGPSSVVGATVADTLPAAIVGATWTCVGGGGGACPASGSGNIAAGVNLPPGGTATFTVTGTVSAAAVGTLSNTATIATPAGVTDPNPANNSATDTDTLVPTADLAIVKTDGTATAVPGTAVIYTIVASNLGPSNASGATVADALPAVLTGASWTCAGAGGGACPASGVGNINAAVSLPVGASVTFTLTATLSAAATGTLANTTTIAAPAGVIDSNPANNAATDTDTINPTADLAITKTDGVTSVTPGAGVTYTIVASNAGPSAVTGATVADTLPAALTGVAWTCVGAGGGTCPATGSGNIGASVNLPAGATATFTVTATLSASATGTLTNTATVAVPAGVTDPNPANNAATDSDTISPTADLAITKTDGTTSAVPGSPVTYTIVASNAGPSAVTGATVTDTLPATLTGATWTCVGAGGGTCPASGSGNINASVTLPVGATATFTLTTTLSATATGTLSNTATIAAPVGVTDPNPGNNSATDTDSINPTADLSITKTDGSATAIPGNPVTYTIVASNAGPSAATGATVVDTLAATLTGATWICVGAGGGICPPSGSGNINASVTLPAGGTATFTLTATVSPTATGTLLNTATVAAPAGVTDPNPANNSATDSDALNAQVSLSVVKTDGSATYTPGGTATYTITVTNAGPSAAANVTLTDALPAGVALSASATCVASGAAGCGAVTGTTGQTSFGTTGATLGAVAADKLVFTVPVSFAASLTTDPLVNTATATDLAASGPGSSASGSDSDTRNAAVTLAVTKDDGATTYTPGGTATYTVTVANTGLTDALDVAVADALPAGVTLAATASCVANGTSSCGTVTGTTGQTSFGTTGARVDAGGANTIVFTLPVAFAGGMSANPLVNTATATDAPTGATASGSDSDTLSTNVTLAATKTDGSATYTPGGTAIYTVTVANTGLSDALDVTVADTVPAGVTLSANATCVANGTSSCGTVTGTTGQTSFGATAARVDAGGANTLVFTVPVAFAAGMTTDPLINTVNATDLASGNTASASDSDALSAAVTLGVVKTDGSATYTPGGTATYTITVTNTGLSDALNVTVSDALPVGATLAANATCAATGASSCGTVTGATGQTSFGATAASVNAGAANAIVFTVPVVFAAGMTTDPLINTATATDLASGITANGLDSDALSATLVLAVTKTDGSAVYTPGGTATYTVTIANSGPSDALDVTVNDPFPPGVTLTAGATCVASGTSSCGTVTGTAGQMSFGATGARVDAGPGSTLVFTVPVAFAASLTANPLVNTVAATDALTGFAAFGTDSDALAANVSLALAKTDGSATYTPGGTAVYTVTVTNTGVSDAVNVSVADPLPAGVTLGANATCVASGASSCGTVTGTTGQTTFGASGATVVAGAANALVLTAPVAFAPGMSANPLVNTATANDLASGATANGSDSDTLVPAIGLGVTKTDGSATYTPGGTATYTIVVTNGGPSNAANITVTDALPAGVTVAANVTCTAAGTASCGTVTGAAGATSFGATGATIVAGAGNQLTFTAPVGFAAGMTTNPLVNTVTASDPAAPGPVSATDSDALAAVADLVMVKTGPATLVAGGAITYTLAISNAGPSSANGATFNDNVPGAIVGIAASCGGAAGGAACGLVTVVGNTVTGVVTNLPVGGSVVITITGTLSGATSGALTNVATVVPPGGVGDPTPGNSSSSATTNVSGAVATQIPVNAPWALALACLVLGVLGMRFARTRP